MKSVEDSVDKMFLSGTRVTFTLKEDAKLDEKKLAKKLKKAIEDQKGMKFGSVTSRETTRAKAAYVAKTPGLT